MDKEICKECEYYVLQTDYKLCKAKPACELVEKSNGDYEFLTNIEKCPKRKRK